MNTIEDYLTYLESQGHGVTARQIRSLLEAERASYRLSVDETLQASAERDEALAFLRRTAMGGSIVSSAAMTPTQIAIARAGDRMLVMSDGCGFVYVPGATSVPRVVRNLEPHLPAEDWSKHSPVEPAPATTAEAPPLRMTAAEFQADPAAAMRAAEHGTVEVIDGNGERIGSLSVPSDDVPPRVTAEDWEKLRAMLAEAQAVGENLDAVRSRFGLETPTPADAFAAIRARHDAVEQRREWTSTVVTSDGERAHLDRGELLDIVCKVIGGER